MIQSSDQFLRASVSRVKWNEMRGRKSRPHSGGAGGSTYIQDKEVQRHGPGLGREERGWAWDEEQMRYVGMPAVYVWDGREGGSYDCGDGRELIPAARRDVRGDDAPR